MKLLTTAMVDNLAEKLNKCMLNGGCYISIVCIKSGPQKLSITWSGEVSAIQGFKVSGRTVETFRIFCYIMGVCC